MVMLIVCLAAPLLIAPLIVLACRHLFATFVQEGASLFVGLDIHRPWAMTLATPIAVVNAIIFVLAWWAALGVSAMGESSFALAAPFLVAIGLGFGLTYIFVKEKLNLEMGRAFMVGALVFAGGNLPIMLAIPALLMVISALDLSAAINHEPSY